MANRKSKFSVAAFFGLVAEKDDDVLPVQVKESTETFQPTTKGTLGHSVQTIGITRSILPPLTGTNPEGVQLAKEIHAKAFREALKRLEGEEEFEGMKLTRKVRRELAERTALLAVERLA